MAMDDPPHEGAAIELEPLVNAHEV
jgi:hypothetical protein